MQQAESIQAARMLSDCSWLLGPPSPSAPPRILSSLRSPSCSPSEYSLGGRGGEEERVIAHSYLASEWVGHKGTDSRGDFLA